MRAALLAATVVLAASATAATACPNRTAEAPWSQVRSLKYDVDHTRHLTVSAELVGRGVASWTIATENCAPLEVHPHGRRVQHAEPTVPERCFDRNRMAITAHYVDGTSELILGDRQPASRMMSRRARSCSASGATPWLGLAGGGLAFALAGLVARRRRRVVAV